MEKISIVIPAYNAEETIEQAVGSVLDQEVPKEIIVVDDGSSDRTPEILARMSTDHPEIRVLRQENAGVSAARNAGISAATGKWLMTLDDDDYIDSGMLPAMEEAVQRENADLAVCGMKLQYEDRTESFAEEPLAADRAEFLCRKMTVLYDRHQLTTHSNKLYDLDLIRRENLRYNEELQINEDIDFVFRYLTAAGRIVLVGEAYLNYVQHAAGGSLITTFRKNGISSSLLLVKDLENLFDSLRKETEENPADGRTGTAAGTPHRTGEGSRKDLAALEQDMDRRMLVHILSFAGLMYYRSSMDDREKETEIRLLADNKTFRRLLRRTRPEDLKTFAAKTLLSARMCGLYHAISRRMYRGCN